VIVPNEPLEDSRNTGGDFQKVIETVILLSTEYLK
jgi:hypothetical protein